MNKTQMYRHKILSCAKKILETEGEESITIEKIATMCKISKSTIYSCFLNKDDLITHLGNFSIEDGFFISSTRDLILHKAIEAFTEFGFDGVDMDKIARLADIRRTTIYHYFSSKEELWENCIIYIIDKQKSFIETIMSTDKIPMEKIDEYIDYLYKPANRHCNILIIIGYYHYLGNEKIHELHKELINMKLNFFTSMIEDGKQKGNYKKDINSNLAAKFITTFLYGLSLINENDTSESRKILFNLLHDFMKENN